MSSTTDLETQYCAQNYHPLPLVLTRCKGVFVRDNEGSKYLDRMSAYAAASHGHASPGLASPLIIGKVETDWAVTQIRRALDELKPHRLAS